MNWQAELRDLLDRVPGRAERLITAIDEKRIDGMTFGRPTECGTVACIYGHVYGNAFGACSAALEVNGFCLSPLEHHLLRKDPTGAKTIRPEVLLWLAEHGTALNPHNATPGETAVLYETVAG